MSSSPCGRSSGWCSEAAHCEAFDLAATELAECSAARVADYIAGAAPVTAATCSRTRSWCGRMAVVACGTRIAAGQSSSTALGTASYASVHPRSSSRTGLTARCSGGRARLCAARSCAAAASLIGLAACLSLARMAVGSARGHGRGHLGGGRRANGIAERGLFAKPGSRHRPTRRSPTCDVDRGPPGSNCVCCSLVTGRCACLCFQCSPALRRRQAIVACVGRRCGFPKPRP